MMAPLSTTLKQLESRNSIAWVLNNDIKTERGLSFDFDRFSFMIDPWLDWTPEQGTRKCSQIGWSVMTNLKLFYAAKFGIPGYGVPAANVIYTMPTDNDIKSFVPSKTNALIANNKPIRDYFRDENGKVDVDSIERKKIGNSFIYFKGTRSQTAALAITSDLNIHDEADRSVKDIVDQYESRLGTSLYKGRWIFSNPSAPNMPADLMYQLSDQKHWFIKCEHCGHWQFLGWFKMSEHEFKTADHCFIDDKNGLYVCSKCGLPITDDNRKRGRWVKKVHSNVSGYWVSHLMCSWISAKELLKTEATKQKAYFMNFALGLPYVGSDVVVDAQTIVNNIQLTEVNWQPGQVAMGVDNGDEKHYVIGNEQGIFEIGKTKDWALIELLINKYKPYTVVDLNPYPNKPKELASKYPHVWCSFYVSDSKNLELVEWGQNDKRHMVYPHRNQSMDDLINRIFAGEIKFLHAKAYWEEYISHWETLYRADEETSLGIVRGVWNTSTGMDHYCHATLYFRIALQRMMQGRGVVMKAPGSDTLSQVARQVGGVRTAPVPGSAPQTIQQPHSFIPDLSKTNRGGSGAKSGKM